MQAQNKYYKAPDSLRQGVPSKRGRWQKITVTRAVGQECVRVNSAIVDLLGKQVQFSCCIGSATNQMKGSPCVTSVRRMGVNQHQRIPIASFQPQESRDGSPVLENIVVVPMYVSGTCGIDIHFLPV